MIRQLMPGETLHVQKHLVFFEDWLLYLPYDAMNAQPCTSRPNKRLAVTCRVMSLCKLFDC